MEVVQSGSRHLLIWNSSEPYFFPILWAAVGSFGPKLRCLSGPRPASSCGLVSVPAQEGNSINYASNLRFSPGLEWKVGRERWEAERRV